jgi:hypothetical protein
MAWIALSIGLAGFISGFLAGISSAPTGGGLASTVGGAIVGIIATISQSKEIEVTQLAEIGKLFCLFQIALIFSYIFGNILRKKGKLKWMGL